MSEKSGIYPRWLWQAFALPGVVWLILLFLVPFYAVIGVAFGGVDPIFLIPVPAWNPLDWNAEAVIQTLSGFLPGGDYWAVFWRTTLYVAVALALCLLVGYPVAYYISRHARRTKSILLALLVLPFWVSYLMRMLAWVNLFAPSGYVNDFLAWSHILPDPPDWLNGNPVSVVLALVYGYIPYLILPLLAALDRIDKSLLEAARDLGASPARAFLHVTLPLSMTGVLGASVIIALPMFGDYYTPNIISGSPTTSMLGNQIDLFFHGGPQPQIGASLTLVLSLFLAVLMTYYMYSVARSTREVRDE
ncbi:MAG TPA: ABC transporter permease [Hypericibacter adhaerens]|jgi:spermidine/putrescine transport system permease protein|uniref:ABC transporter permease n=1 Tax=Hypericibacter adhaerens TaxID=2602016 RepID=UPI002BA8C666|nr:ABC transporter permease [Hypericibacter adhaerens]HWA44648.1 ABC transporter permease [Hypericibacter adhaerens]